MLRRPPTPAHLMILTLFALALLAGCGQVPAAGTAQQGAASETASQSTTVQTAAPTATIAPTPIPRTNNPHALILSTTTSTQDSGLLDALIPQFEQQSGYRRRGRSPTSAQATRSATARLTSRSSRGLP